MNNNTRQRQHHEWEAAIWDSTLDATKKLILLALKSYADGEGGSCFPSIETLVHKTSYKDRTIRRHIHEMQQMGLVIVTHRVTAQGNTSNDYRLVFDAIKGQSGADRGSGGGGSTIRGGMILDQEGGDLRSADLSNDLSNDPSTLILETTTAIFPEPTEPAPQRLTAVPSQNPLSSTPVSATPVMQGVGSAAATRESQVEITPPRDQFGRPQRNASLVPPLHPVQVGNGTPWLPMAPWTSKEEHDEFAAYLHRSFPGKPEGYYHKIIDRVGKGDFDNRSWLAFKAGNSPESMGAALSIPEEWKRLLEAEQRAVSESNPQWSEVDCQLRGLNNFRGKFTYCRNGQESKLGQAADDWALGLLNALKAQSAA